MEEAARKRQERLAALRAGAPVAEVAQPKEDIIKKLAHEQMDDPREEVVTEQEAAPSTSIFAGDQTLEEQMKFLLNEAKSLPSLAQMGEVTLDELAPKKANWDLKQDYQRRIEGLDKETNRAIVELIHKRLEE